MTTFEQAPLERALLEPVTLDPATGDDAATDAQLRLIEGGRNERDWVLDARTKRHGRYGIAQVRATLRRATPPRPLEHPGADPVAC
jgi:hypothetical protein